jgi:hypothetical protein
MGRKPLLLLFLAFAQTVYAMDIRISGKELGLYVRPEYNRTFYFCADISAAGAVTLNERFTIQSGLALGNTGNEFDIKAFASGDAALPVPIPLYVSAAYIYNGLPGYETHTQAILPLISYKGRWAGLSLGTNLRFTSFFNEPAVFESMISFSGYVNFLNNRILRLGMRVANFSDFTAGNTGSYFLNLNSAIRLNGRTSLIHEIEILQSGSIAAAANLYGFAYRGGVVFSW